MVSGMRHRGGNGENGSSIFLSLIKLRRGFCARRAWPECAVSRGGQRRRRARAYSPGGRGYRRLLELSARAWLMKRCQARAQCAGKPAMARIISSSIRLFVFIALANGGGYLAFATAAAARPTFRISAAALYVLIERHLVYERPCILRQRYQSGALIFALFSPSRHFSRKGGVLARAQSTRA